jgi:hypothetical protein
VSVSIVGDFASDGPAHERFKGSCGPERLPGSATLSGLSMLARMTGILGRYR